MLSGANSEVLSATGNVTTGGNASACKVILAAGSGAAATVGVYDNDSATGPLKLALAAPAGASSPADGEWFAITSGNIHLVLTGAGVNATVYWK